MTVQKFDHPSKKVLVTGVSGTGKTTLFEKLVRAEKARIKFFYDHQGEFSSRFKMRPIFDHEALVNQTAYGGNVVFDPVRLFPGRAAKGFEFYCDYCFAQAEVIPGRKILVVDELQKLVSNSVEPAQLMVVCDTGRRYQLDLFCISQAPNRIHNSVRNQLTEVYTFRQSDANAIKYLEENGFNSDQVRALENGCFVHRNLNTGETKEGGTAFRPDKKRA